MRDTELKATKQNLCKLVQKFSTPETLDLIKTELADCKTDAERVEWFMNCFFCFNQPYVIVKINTSNTWGLIDNIEDEQGDCAEYLDLFNDNIIREWHE